MALMGAHSRLGFGLNCEMRLSCAFSLFALAVVAGCAPAPVITPHRIVSDNPCIDAILADVARPEQIGAVSSYSQDARASSVPLAWARHFPAIKGTAEEVIAARPSLYLSDSLKSAYTRRAIARAGIPMLSLPVPNSISESLAQIRLVAHAIGRDEAGAALVAKIEFATRPPARVMPRIALIYQHEGLVLGAHTLAEDELRHAGFENAAPLYTDKPWDIVPLEHILAHPPQLILAPVDEQGHEGRTLKHLRSLLSKYGRRVTIQDFSPQLLYCGAASLLRARLRLNEVRETLE